MKKESHSIFKVGIWYEISSKQISVSLIIENNKNKLIVNTYWKYPRLDPRSLVLVVKKTLINNLAASCTFVLKWNFIFSKINIMPVEQVNIGKYLQKRNNWITEFKDW